MLQPGCINLRVTLHHIVRVEESVTVEAGLPQGTQKKPARKRAGQTGSAAGAAKKGDAAAAVKAAPVGTKGSRK